MGELLHFNIDVGKEEKPIAADKNVANPKVLEWETRERSAMGLIYLNTVPNLRTIIENSLSAVGCRSLKDSI